MWTSLRPWITALVDRLGHVPYRDSKLTRLLRDALGRGLHSFPFPPNVSTFCAIRWVHDFPPVYETGTRGGVTKTA
jgi:hypothetical protein